MEMNRMRVHAAVDERDAEAITLGTAQRWPGHAPVVSPRWKEEPRRNLNLFVLSGNGVLTQRLTVWQGGHFPSIEVNQHLHWVETIAGMVYNAHGHALMVCVHRLGRRGWGCPVLRRW
jgi:hypothetical protein